MEHQMPLSRMPTLRQLRAFACVAKSGSVGAAASLLGLTQPAVTQALTKLESIVGTTLLSRTPNGSFPNAAGEKFLPYVVRCFGLLSECLYELFLIEPAKCSYKSPSITHKLTDTHLRCLLAIVEAPLFEVAARQVDVTPASLQRSARDLEKLLARELFNKSADGLEANLTAVKFAKRVRRAFGEIQFGIEQIKNAQTDVCIRIGKDFSVNGHLIGEVIAEFLTAYPMAVIDLQDDGYEALLANLHSGKLDILISNTRLPSDVRDIVEHACLRDDYHIVARRHHPLTRSGADISLSELARFPWTIPPAGTPRLESLQSLFANSQHQPKISVESNSTSLQRHLLENSDCLTILSMREIKTDLAPLSEIEFLPYRESLGAAFLKCVVRANWEPTKLQQHFMDYFRRHCEAVAHCN